MLQRKLIRLGFVALAAASLLAGCGRKGPLELPPNAPPPTPAEAAAAARAQPAVDNPGLIQPPNRTVDVPGGAGLDGASRGPAAPINGAKPASDKPFLLDPLL